MEGYDEWVLHIAELRRGAVGAVGAVQTQFKIQMHCSVRVTGRAGGWNQHRRAGPQREPSVNHASAAVVAAGPEQHPNTAQPTILTTFLPSATHHRAQDPPPRRPAARPVRQRRLCAVCSLTQPAARNPLAACPRVQGTKTTSMDTSHSIRPLLRAFI
ncbi:hypothetical protein P154DRAFT_578014 [Amniculicola lignicola CBS 123094]|uniref:Uncharacterized protein n=1 Tax=Amniculicola lignicola CBS 123094 TaxID=1392246 RepID=A0A6A5WE59_9PLEO|nr:hypothetical protein P154DRAFT_578014 [Amniculicola lignicola CBS 123094]